MRDEDEDFSYYCNRCKSELANGGIKFEIYNNRGHSIEEDNFELCHDCSLSFIDFMKLVKR